MKDLKKTLKAMIIFCICLVPLTSQSEENVLPIFAVHFPPYEFDPAQDSKKNELKGFDVEVVEEIFLRMGKPAKVMFRPWSRALLHTKEGKVMGLLSCAKTKEREVYLYHSDPISLSSVGYFTHKDYTGPLYTSLESMRGERLRITAVKNYVPQKELEQLSIKHTSSRSDKIALKILLADRVDFIYGWKEGTFFIAKQMGVSNKLIFNLIKVSNYRLCFSKKWPGAKKLLDQFNVGLKQLKADGTYKKIHDKYR